MPMDDVVIVGGGPTGVELAGILPEVARHGMARDFRRFVGCTPSRFVAARPGLSVSLVDLPLS